MSAVERHASDLRNVVRQRKSAEGRAAQAWDDQVRRSFETRVLAPLDRETSIAVRAIDELASAMTQARSQLH